MKKRIVSLLLALVMALTLTLPAYAEGGTTTTPVNGIVSYMDWDSTEKKLVEETKNLTYTVVADSTTTTDDVTWGAENTTTYYVVNDTSVTINGTVTAYGDVHLILCDGATLTVNGGVAVEDTTPTEGDNSNLTIYGQSGQTGKLVANGGVNSSFSAGIYSPSYGELTINGGIIEATGGNHAEGQPVTASYGIYGSYVFINGGKVEATGGEAVAPSDSTSDSNAYSGGISAWNMTVNGGEVTATGGTATGGHGESFGIQADLTVNGGTVTAKGGTAKATGAKQYAYSYGIYAGDALNVNGGVVNATGGEAADGDDTHSYGICVRRYDAANRTYHGKLTIKGGTVQATGGDADSDGYNAESYGIYVGTNLTIENGTVNATGGDADANEASSYGIYVYGVDTNDDNGLTVKSGNVTATGGNAEADDEAYSHGICMESGDLIIEGGTVEASGNKAESDNDNAYSNGICVYDGDMTIKGENTTVTAIAGAAEGSDKARSCGIYVDGGYDNDEGYYGNLAIEGGTVNATGNKAEADYGDAYSYGIRVYAYLDIEDSVVTATGGTAEATDEDAYAESYGICVKNGNMTVKGGTVTANGGTANSEYAAYSYGIRVENGNMTVEGKSTTVIATGGTVNSTGAAAESDGIYVYKDLTIGNGEVTAKGGTATATGEESWVWSYGIHVEDKLTIDGGTVIAETTATGNIYNKNALDCDSGYELPTTYWWRTAESGAYSKYPGTEYPCDDKHTYVEITTTEQPTTDDTGGTDETPDSSTNPDTNTGTGHKRYYTSNQNADAKSADTYDAGIAAYVVMGGISTVTSAAWLRRRKK